MVSGEGLKSNFLLPHLTPSIGDASVMLEVTSSFRYNPILTLIFLPAFKTSLYKMIFNSPTGYCCEYCVLTVVLWQVYYH